MQGVPSAGGKDYMNRAIMRHILLFISMLLWAWPCWAAPVSSAHIGDALVMNGDEDLLLYFRLLDGLTPQMEEGVKNGIPLTFSFQVELHHHTVKGLQPVANISFTNRLQFDTLKEEYQFVTSRHPEQTVTVKTLAEAGQLMCWVHDLSLFPLRALQARERYTVKIMASFDRRGLPARFQNVLGFVSLWDFSTDWHYISFTMPPEAGS